MKGRFFHPASRNPESGRGLRIASYAAIAIACTIIGILIASNLDLPARSVAQGPASYSQTGVYPVVERNGEYESPFVQVVEKVQNAVVNISAKSRERDLPWYFPDIAAHAPKCRFNDCTHTEEPDCAVREAVERGELPPRRYESYLRILESLLEG